jgi:hypothetical protein
VIIPQGGKISPDPHRFQGVWKKEMTALELKQIKKFMHTLLLTDAFDEFCVAEVHLVTFAEFTIDGTLHPEFFEDAENSAEAVEESSSEGLVRWKQLRGNVFSLIKGTRPPLSFRIVFLLPREHTVALIQDCGSTLSEKDVKSLSLNCMFRSGSLLLTSGCSITAFTKERTLERAWDDAVVSLTRRLGID